MIKTLYVCDLCGYQLKNAWDVTRFNIEMYCGSGSQKIVTTSKLVDTCHRCKKKFEDDTKLAVESLLDK